MNRRVRTTTLLAGTATIRSYDRNAICTTVEYRVYRSAITGLNGSFAMPWTLFIN